MTSIVLHILQILPRFGLIDDQTDRWAMFVAAIERLNATAEPGVRFKVFFLGRHGQGYRACLRMPRSFVSRATADVRRDNVGRAKYGTKVGR